MDNTARLEIANNFGNTIPNANQLITREGYFAGGTVNTSQTSTIPNGG